MNCLILAYKYRSETMAVCMDRVLRDAGIAPEIPVTYAGRLDPMAEGLVIFLVGEMRYHKELFQKLPKSYDVQFFTGYETDTYDVLGIVRQVPENIEIHDLGNSVNAFQQAGIFVQKFPPYSSRRVDGKPMFAHARENTSHTIEHEVEVFGYSNFSVVSIPSGQFVSEIIRDITAVAGDFRQDLVVQSWQDISKTFPETITLYGMTILCGSGFYVRQWVHDFGFFLGTGAVTFSIIRGTIGVFTMSMLNGESYRIFTESDDVIRDLNAIH